MLISPSQAEHFHRLYPQLLRFAVEKKAEAKRRKSLLNDLKPRPKVQAVIEAREVLFSHPELIDIFVAKNPENICDEYLAIISKWKNFKKGKFLIERDLKRYTIFMDSSDLPRAYGVLGLNSEIYEMIGDQPLPIMIETVLLPWLGQIIHDGALVSYSIIFGSNIRRSLKADYMAAKKRGIITTL